MLDNTVRHLLKATLGEMFTGRLKGAGSLIACVADKLRTIPGFSLSATQASSLIEEVTKEKPP